MRICIHKKQQGAALIVALLMLLVLTIVGISGMGDSIFDLRMTGNIQSHYDSLQQADTGISAAISQPGDNFKGIDQTDIFSDTGTNALKDYINSNVSTKYLYEGSAPRGFSQKEWSGWYYIVDSDHSDSVTGAKTHVYQGVIQVIQKIK
jgi:hypothetical protein